MKRERERERESKKEYLANRAFLQHYWYCSAGETTMKMAQTLIARCQNHADAGADTDRAAIAIGDTHTITEGVCCCSFSFTCKLTHHNQKIEKPSKVAKKKGNTVVC